MVPFSSEKSALDFIASIFIASAGAKDSLSDPNGTEALHDPHGQNVGHNIKDH